MINKTGYFLKITLNDDALGRFLDAIANYGTTRLFGELAFEIDS